MAINFSQFFFRSLYLTIALVRPFSNLDGIFGQSNPTIACDWGDSPIFIPVPKYRSLDVGLTGRSSNQCYHKYFHYGSFIFEFNDWLLFFESPDRPYPYSPINFLCWIISDFIFLITSDYSGPVISIMVTHRVIFVIEESNSLFGLFLCCIVCSVLDHYRKEGPVYIVHPYSKWAGVLFGFCQYR